MKQQMTVEQTRLHLAGLLQQLQQALIALVQVRFVEAVGHQQTNPRIGGQQIGNDPQGVATVAT